MPPSTSWGWWLLFVAFALSVLPLQMTCTGLPSTFMQSASTYEMEQQSELVELVEGGSWRPRALNFNVTDSQRRTLERLAKVTGALATSLAKARTDMYLHCSWSINRQRYLGQALLNHAREKVPAGCC